MCVLWLMGVDGGDRENSSREGSRKLKKKNNFLFVFFFFSSKILFLFSVWLNLAPFLEESGPMTTAIGSPQVAATGATEAAIVPPVVAAASTSDARSSGNINQRRTSEKRNKCKKKNAEK